MEKKFDNPIHNFRAIAIICIVLLHAIYAISSPKVTSLSVDAKRFFECLNSTLFQSSTFFFVFVSGYLSYKIFRDINYSKFIVKKLKNILSPYIICSIFFITISAIKYHITGVYLWGMPEPRCFSDIMRMLFYGQAQGQYWYIPFIFIVFIVTHLFIKYIERNIIFIIFLTVFIPIFFPRFVPDISIDKWFITNFTYFLPMYFIGIASCIYKNEILNFIEINFIKILCVFFLLSAAHLLKQYILFTTGIQACLYIQKTLATFIIFYMLNIFNYNSAILASIAQYSFGIFFLHQFFINILSHRIINLISSSDCIILNIVAIIVNAVIILLLSWISCLFLKKLFGRFSRNILGI